MKQEVEEQQDFVKEVTKMSDDFDRWYTDVVRKAELADWSGVRGMMVVRPYGWAMWETITRAFDSAAVIRFLKKLLRQRRETGTRAPNPPGGGQVAKLAEAQREKVRAYMRRTQHDATVSEVHTYVATTLQRQGSRATVGRGLQSLDLPRKKNASGPRAG